VAGMATHSQYSEVKAMHTRLPRAMLVTLAVFLGAVAVSMATGGTLSDIGFFVYAAALLVLTLLAVGWLVLQLSATRR
jgi:hypothetical protein